MAQRIECTMATSARPFIAGAPEGMARHHLPPVQARLQPVFHEDAVPIQENFGTALRSGSHDMTRAISTVMPSSV